VRSNNHLAAKGGFAGTGDGCILACGGVSATKYEDFVDIYEGLRILSET
jgi:hypothetical protein